MWPGLQAACDGRIGPEVLLDGTSTAVLDRGASLDDEGDRGGPTLGGLPEGVSHERARCLRGRSAPGERYRAEDRLSRQSYLWVTPDSNRSPISSVKNFETEALLTFLA